MLIDIDGADKIIRTPVSIMHYTVSSVTVLKQWWQWLIFWYLFHIYPCLSYFCHDYNVQYSIL